MFKNLIYFIDALLSDLSYSQSEDSSYENIKSSKPESNVLMNNKHSANNMFIDESKKTCGVIYILNSI